MYIVYSKNTLTNIVSVCTLPVPPCSGRPSSLAKEVGHEELLALCTGAAIAHNWSESIAIGEHCIIVAGAQAALRGGMSGYWCNITVIHIVISRAQLIQMIACQWFAIG